MSEAQFDSSLQGQRQQRLAKAAKLRDLGIDPYPAKSKKSHKNADIINEFDDMQGKNVVLTGRLMSWRSHGQLAFSDLQDDSGKVQLYFKQDEISPFNSESDHLGWEQLELLDVGDFVQAEGTVLKTESGEISLLVRELRILVKTIRPLPSKWHGITDKEERFRRRYLDMTMNPDVRERMKRRALFWQATREFLISKGFYEVNIPVLEHIPGGGDATPFVTHMNALDEDFYLRISHELPLKRLIGAGFEKVFDIGARFRNEGLSDEHLPEHVAMEFYWAYADWKDGMQLIQEMYAYILDRVYGGKKVFNIRGFEVDFSKEWEVLDFATIMRDRFGITDLYNVTLDEVAKALEDNNIQFHRDTLNIPRGVDTLWKSIRKEIAGPAFLVNHPKFLSPLQKPSLENPQMVERFQPIIAGSELGNGWSEVNDPIDQYERFVEQQAMRDAGDDEAQWLDIDYVEMLEYGMAPNFGWGNSERMFWFLEDVTAREGTPFPQLKFHISDDTKKIYPEVDFDSIRNPGADAAGNKYTGNEYKIVMVVREDLESWKLTNVIGHLTTYLGAKAGTGIIGSDKFETNDGKQAIPANSTLPVITMSAKSATQLYNLLAKVEEANLEHLAFVKEMMDFHKDEEIQNALVNQDKSELDYLGVGIFGKAEDIDKLTKKFSLWK